MPSPSRTLHSLLNRRPVSWIEERPSNQLVLPSCHIGVEMELEGTGASPLSRFERDTSLHNPLITAVQDGSLRNGIELVFSRPLFGESALAAIDHMYTVRDRLELGGSARTSTHVHVNFSDTSDTLDTLRSTIATYLLVERAMSITAGPHREHNTFCVPTYVMNPGNERRFYDIVAAEGNDRRALDAITNLGHENNRYAAMNLASLYRHGTVEFRQLGTVERNQLLMWINTLLSIKKCGLANSVQQVLNGPDNLDDFVRDMLGEHASNCLIIDDDGRNYFTAARQRMRSMLEAATVTTTATVTEVSGDWTALSEQLNSYMSWLASIKNLLNQNGPSFESAVQAAAAWARVETSGRMYATNDRNARMRNDWWDVGPAVGVRNLLVNDTNPISVEAVMEFRTATNAIPNESVINLVDRLERVANYLTMAYVTEQNPSAPSAERNRRRSDAVIAINGLIDRIDNIRRAVNIFREQERAARFRNRIADETMRTATATMARYAAQLSTQTLTVGAGDTTVRIADPREQAYANLRSIIEDQPNDTDGDNV